MQFCCLFCFFPIGKQVCLQGFGYEAEYHYHIIQQTFWIALKLSVANFLPLPTAVSLSAPLCTELVEADSQGKKNPPQKTKKPKSKFSCHRLQPGYQFYTYTNKLNLCTESSKGVFINKTVTFLEYFTQ